MFFGKSLFIVGLGAKVVVVVRGVVHIQSAPLRNVVDEVAVGAGRCKFVDHGAHHVGIGFVILFSVELALLILEFHFKVKITCYVETCLDEVFHVKIVGLVHIVTGFLDGVVAHVLQARSASHLLGEELIVGVAVGEGSVGIVKSVVCHRVGLTHV